MSTSLTNRMKRPKILRFSASVLRRRSVPRWACWTVLLPLLAVSNASAQDRPSGTPWRASFSELNQQASQQQTNRQPPVQPARTNLSSPPPNQTANQSATGFRNADDTPSTGSSSKPATASGQRDADNRDSAADRVPTLKASSSTQVDRTMSQLPNDAGQVWREYDLTPYTSQVKTVNNPQQAVLDWVLRQTGKDMWFNQPLGILNASKSKLIVYHTPEIQAEVRRIVDRFIRTRGQIQNFNVTLATVGNPNWRSQAYPMLQSVDVQTPGVEAWMISKENAAILFGQLKRRSDYKEHNAGKVTSHDGQSFVLEKTKPVPLVRSLRWLPGQSPGYEPLITTINEGFTLGISPLSSLDNRTIEAAIKCDVDQVESLIPVKVPVPGVNNTLQQIDINVPHIVSWRLHERFRWPSDQILLLSCGVVVDPAPETSRSLNPFGQGQKSKRADALLMVEYRGPANGGNLPRTAGRSTLGPLK